MGGKRCASASSRTSLKPGHAARPAQRRALASTTERTMGSARTLPESLAPKPEIRERHQFGSERAAAKRMRAERHIDHRCARGGGCELSIASIRSAAPLNAPSSRAAPEYLGQSPDASCRSRMARVGTTFSVRSTKLRLTTSRLRPRRSAAEARSKIARLHDWKIKRY
jgi:hypothetical protein